MWGFLNFPADKLLAIIVRIPLIRLDNVWPSIYIR